MDSIDNLSGRFADVYRNLTRKCLSVRIAGRVRAHRPSVNMLNVCFVVHESGRGRVIETGRKNVHAYIRGTICADGEQITDLLREQALLGRGDWVQVTYNPRKYTHFVTVEGEKRVHTASVAIIDRLGHIYAQGVR